MSRNGILFLHLLLWNQKELLGSFGFDIFEVFNDHFLGKHLEKQVEKAGLDATEHGVDLLQMLQQELLLVQLHLALVHLLVALPYQESDQLLQLLFYKEELAFDSGHVGIPVVGDPDADERLALHLLFLFLLPLHFLFDVQQVDIVKYVFRLVFLRKFFDLQSVF